MSIKQKISANASVPGLLMALVASVVSIQLCAAEVQQARLLVGIVVDGLDTDYLDLLRERFGEGGFRRLEREAAFIPSADFGPGLDATAATRSRHRLPTAMMLFSSASSRKRRSIRPSLWPVTLQKPE